MAAVRLYRPGESEPSKSLTVGDCLRLYARHCAAEGVHGPAARADREYTFKLFVEATGDLPVSDAKPYHLTDFIEAHPEWKSVSTRRAKANGIRAAFNWAFKQERISRNPFASVRYAENERRPEMPDDLLLRLERVANKQFEVVLRFLRLTACRIGELCAADWADVDLERGIWTIHRHKSRKFTGRPKVVALVGEAVALVKAIAPATFLNAQPALVANQATGNATPAAEVPIFTNTRGKRWTDAALGYALRRLKEKHGIETAASLHGLRHRALSAMIENGAPIKLVAEQAGHSTTAVTEKFYWHRTADQIEAIRAAAALGVPKNP